MAGWTALTEELHRWRDAGAVATFWWRDDDAVEVTPQLDALLACAAAIPLALAVIPGLANQDLAARLVDHGGVVVLQHGWRHDNHAPSGNSEYPANRSEAEVSEELAAGKRTLTALFGAQAIPVFTPPWHGFYDGFLPLLRRNGLVGISQLGPRPSLLAAEGIVQANIHVSLIRWSSPPSFGDDAEPYIEKLIDHLRGRRCGRYDATEPTGLLTHHLVQDDKSYAFMSRFAALVAAHPAAAWTDAATLVGFRRSAD